jgi:hypothetical protein
MNKFDTMFKQEQNKIAIEKDLAQQQIDAKAKVIIDFCEENQIFDFLDYLNNKFIVKKTSVNYHVDRQIYTVDMVYSYNREKAIQDIKNGYRFRAGIQYKWSNGGIYDTLVVDCINFKPVLTYEDKRVTPEEFMQTVISQIQTTIDKNIGSIQIIEK